jgi:energy-coupling factor transporter ATP-binding protein EcfA2
MPQIFEHQPIVARTEQLGTLRAQLKLLKNGKGSVVCVAGESAFGKTTLLRAFAGEAAHDDELNMIYAECQTPVGTFNLGNLQPFLPFARALEELLNHENATAKKKLAVNIGMTVLSTIPLAGDLFYAFKEISKDVRDFKKDKSFKSANPAVREYFDAFKNYAESKPLVLLLDDMQWCDAQSAELLKALAADIAHLPIMLVVAYRPSLVEKGGIPLTQFLKDFQKETTFVKHIEVSEFSLKDISDCCRALLKNYKPNQKFEEWLLVRSGGVPGIVVEYLRYFQKFSPFRADGSFNEESFKDEFLPASVSAAFEKQLEELSEEDRTILAIASAEGIECTAFVMAHLLNSDVLTAIKKLRSIAQRTQILRSIGAHARYGVRTTVYQFTKTFYYTHFESTLEYEEKLALHAQIAALLNRQFDQTDSEELRRQLAPYIAAHSSEAGNEELTKEMLLKSAETAEKVGSREMAEEAFKEFQVRENDTETKSGLQQKFEKILADEEISDEIGDENLLKTSGGDVSLKTQFDFQMAWHEIVQYHLNGDFESAEEKAIDYSERFKTQLLVSERALFLILAARAATELPELDRAEDLCMQASALTSDAADISTECLLLNAFAAIRLKQNQFDEAHNYLLKAAEQSLKLPQEMRLLTLSNIALLLEDRDPTQAAKYRNAAAKMSASLRFSGFAREALSA